jgi:tetratricopeptide (TPR) repeat protein
MLRSKGWINTAIVLIISALLLGACSKDPQKAKAKYLAAAQKYMKQKHYGDAAVEFRNAIRLDPRSADTYYQLAQAEIAQQNWAGAYGDLQKAIELDPAQLDARLTRGRLFLAARQFDKAEEDANAVVRQDPRSAAAYELLGYTLGSQQKLKPALEAFSKVAELQPNDAHSYLNIGLVEISLRRFNDAEEHLKKAVQMDPKLLKATTDLANLYHLQGKLPEARETLQAGVQNNPDAPQLYVFWANLLSDVGKSTDAEGVLDKLRNQMPKSSDAAIAIGDYYLRKNDVDKALAEYRRGLSESVGNLEIEKRMQDLYLTSNQTEQAAKLDSQLMSQAPKDILVTVLHGRLLLAQGKKQDAIIALQDAVKNAPNSAMAHYYLGLTHWQNENLGQANSELKEALKASPASPGLPLVLRSLVQLNLAQNNTSEAQVYAQELVQKNPADVNARLQLGSIYLSEGQLRQAEEQFVAARQLSPNQAGVHSGLGQLNAREKKWTEAEKEFETAIRLDPSNPTMLSAYADFLVARQQTQKALARVQQFVDANPNNAQGRLILGAVRNDSKNTSAAQAEFERAIQIDPKNIQGYLRLGGLYQQENQTEAAIGQYQKALDLQPKSATLITMVGNLYLDKNDVETARKYYARALEIDPDAVMANANMAWVKAQEGKDLDVALGMAQKAKSQMPEVPSISDTLAWVMYKKGNYSGAIPLLQDCVKKSPDSAVYRYHLGLALVAAGEKESGKTQLQAALRMNKLGAADKEQAQQALGQPD